MDAVRLCYAFRQAHVRIFGVNQPRQPMHRFLALSMRARRAIGRGPALPPAVEICPGSSFDHPQAISLQDEFLRVRGFPQDGPLETQLQYLQSGLRQHPPTFGWCLKDALLHDGGLASREHLARFRARKRRMLVPLGRLEQVASGLLCTTATAERYFGHWITEALPLELLAAERGEQSISLPRRAWLHEEGYRQLLGLRSIAPASVVVGKLWLIDDRGLNADRIGRLHKLRELVRSRFSAGHSRRVFLMRGVTGKPRQLVNELELAEALEQRGFTMVAPERLAADELIRQLYDAEVVVHVEGSAQDHLMLCCGTGSARLCIQPPRGFNAYSKIHADAMGQQFAYVVADEAEGGFRLPLDRLLKTLDLL